MQHLKHGLTAHWMAPIGGNFGQRHQNEGAVLQPWVGKNQLIRGDFALLVGGKIDPMLPTGGIWQNGVTQSEQVKI